MKYVLRSIIVVLIFTVLAVAIIPAAITDSHRDTTVPIPKWEITWVDNLNSSWTDQKLSELSHWKEADALHPTPNIPSGKNHMLKAWIKLKLPELDGSPAISFGQIYGNHVAVVLGGRSLYEARLNYSRDLHQLLLPLSHEDEGKLLYIGVEAMKNRIGIQETPVVGQFDTLLSQFVKKDIMDFILGCGFILIAVIMLMCSLFLNSENIPVWLSLCLVILTIGILVVTYSPFLYTFYGRFGGLYYRLFDLSLFILLPSFTYFFERIFNSGYYSLIRRFRIFQVAYSAFCILFMLATSLFSLNVGPAYEFMTGTLLGFVMIIQFIMLVTLSTVYAAKGNKEAIIFTAGFSIFALSGLGELVYYFLKSQNYHLYLWKWGMVAFVISLIIILGRRFASNHEQVVEYSKRLEMFNNELQRSEKMEIISELAASVAHEVRNPLQVTRGFLQLLTEKSQNQDKLYLNMAVEELDRASSIITDFLTFAKPEVGKVVILSVLDEFRHIEGILNPMANLHGGKVYVDIPENLQIKGNSSKFKQAFINIIKNSIEALQIEGEIRVWAYESSGEVFIHVKDNGEGMNGAELAHLGEPYYSNKTKGTGLGLMVTFRIIEVMQGHIEFKSQKGIGTEVVVRFPSASQ